MTTLEQVVRRLKAALDKNDMITDSDIEDLKLILAEYDRLVELNSKDRDLTPAVPPENDSLGMCFRREDGTTFYVKGGS